MAKKDRKSVFLSSIKAGEQTVRSRFEKADTAPARATRKGSKGGALAAAAGKSPDKVEQAERVVRDSYTMPPAEYETISKVQQRCLKRGLVVSKSEVVRAGFAALGTLADRELFAIIEGLAKVKTGRPPE